jgi:hypothetical protein
MRELIRGNMMMHKVQLVDQFNEADVLQLFQSIEKDAIDPQKKLQNILFVFDDMILESGISHATKKNTVTNEIFMRGRHANVSIILSSQRLMWINQNMRRDNLNVLTVFYGTNRSDLETIAQEHASTYEREDMIRIFKKFLTKKYDFISIDLTSENHFKDKEFRAIVPKESETPVVPEMSL